jgi:NAD(P)-dependent dehydrogenase (short-subunit alcohol dehydrogenase family)
MNLSDKVIVITGAARGIGLTATKLFLDAGARVVLTDWKSGPLAAATEELSHRKDAIDAIVCDVRKEAEVQAAVQRARERFGRIDGLYNNAAVNTRSGSIVGMEERTLDFTLAINLKGTAFFCKYVIPVMLEQGGGSIVNTSSINAHRGGMGCDAYAVSKAAVEALSMQVAHEYAHRNVRCNCICPGVVRTEGTLGASSDHQAAEQRLASVAGPIGRPGTPEEIARIAGFLLSDDSSLITGSTLYGDGGFMTGQRRVTTAQ